MSKLSSSTARSRLIHYVHQLNLITKPKPSPSLDKPFRYYSSSLLSPNNRSSFTKAQTFKQPTSPNLGLSQILSKPRPTHFTNHKITSGFRLFSTKFGQNGDFAKRAIVKPASALLTKYREAIRLQVDAFLRRNYLLLIGAGGVFLCFMLWRVMYGIASTFISLSEGLAKYGFLALSASIVAFSAELVSFSFLASFRKLKALVAIFSLVDGLVRQRCILAADMTAVEFPFLSFCIVSLAVLKGMYLRSRFTINPDKVYRMAMTRLNTAAGVLEVMGAPLSGSEIRAYVMSGGGITLKKFRPDIRSKRCFLIFPIQGSERKGLVNVEVKKKKGQYDMKLLAVDIPMASGPDQRLYLIGDEEEYKVGGGLISQLRDPVVKAMTAAKEFENLDRIEEEEDAERELQEAERKHQEAERKHQEEIEKLEKEKDVSR
ncbi:hypothetical protein ACFE04_014834 [Oxalis oulophora]